MDREAWRAAIRGVAKSWTQLSDLSDLILMLGVLIATETSASRPSQWTELGYIIYVY